MLHSDKKRKKNAAQEVDGVRKEKERLTAVSISFSLVFLRLTDLFSNTGTNISFSPGARVKTRESFSNRCVFT